MRDTTGIRDWRPPFSAQVEHSSRRILAPRRLGAALFTVSALLGVIGWTAPPASASPILIVTFSQSGFSGGATITGSFTGTDVDGDGWLNSFVTGEITAYSMSFSGNLYVTAFSHSIVDFGTAGSVGGLVYRLGGTFLGDDVTTPFEGIASGPISGGVLPPPPASLYGYRTGYGPTGVLPQPFGFVEDNTPAGLVNPLGNLDHVFSHVVITSVATVPEPSALALLVVGIVTVRLRSARSRRVGPEGQSARDHQRGPQGQAYTQRDVASFAPPAS